jgi:large subunit ribosomal protein L1
VRGAFSLPHGIGKEIRVIVFAEGEPAKTAKAAGAMEVGGEELAKKVLDGWLDFDVAIAHPGMMRHVGKLGRVLGPHGKMPSPKSGTVTDNIGQAVKEFKAGKV